MNCSSWPAVVRVAAPPGASNCPISRSGCCCCSPRAYAGELPLLPTSGRDLLLAGCLRLDGLPGHAVARRGAHPTGAGQVLLGDFIGSATAIGSVDPSAARLQALLTSTDVPRVCSGRGGGSARAAIPPSAMPSALPSSAARAPDQQPRAGLDYRWREQRRRTRSTAGRDTCRRRDAHPHHRHWRSRKKACSAVSGFNPGWI